VSGSDDRDADRKALEVIAGAAPAIDDPDADSRLEREVNRVWAALERAGRRNLRDAEEDVRRLLETSPWPEIRGQALIALSQWAPEEALGVARRIASNPSADQLERAAALDAMRELGAREPEDVELYERLAGDSVAPVASAARRALEAT
jgi:hypothetical protein